MQKYLLIIILLFTNSAIAQQGYSLDEELLYRINFGRADDVAILLDKGADPNAKTNIGEAALSVAIGRGDNEAIGMVKALLDKGAMPNVVDKSGYYPIISAARTGKTEMVKLLLERDADFNIKSPTGKTLLDVAKDSGNPDTIKLVQEALDKESAYAASLRTPERFKQFIARYSFDSCEYQYWSYIIASRQSPDKQEEYNDNLSKAKSRIEATIQQIQKYYPNTPTADLQKVSNDSAQSVYDSLEFLVSNNNRREKGVGSGDDMKRRCQKISDDTHIDFPPSVLNVQK